MVYLVLSRTHMIPSFDITMSRVAPIVLYFHYDSFVGHFMLLELLACSASLA